MSAPSHKHFSQFYCEQATVIDVNRKTWTCAVETRHSLKTLRDVKWASPYLHFAGGEGFHYMPEVGAECYLAFPNDTTPPFVLAFVPPPGVVNAQGSDPIRSSADPGGSPTDVTYQAGRPDFNPGDMGLTGRDGNFVLLRRGGVLQLGATPLAQRIMIPVHNFVHDYFENYSMQGPAGELEWLVHRAELDPLGKAACTWELQLREYATDTKASVQVRHMPLGGGLGGKVAWEVTIAPQAIAMADGSAAAPVYSLLVTMSGQKTEVIGADRSVTVTGNDTLKVVGNRSVTVGGSYDLAAANIALAASGSFSLGASILALGGEGALEAVPLGQRLRAWLATAVIDPKSMKINDASLATFDAVLSTTVFAK